MQQPLPEDAIVHNGSPEGVAQCMSAAFAQAWTPAPSGDQAAPMPLPLDVGTALQQLFRAGQEKWPDLALDAASLARHVARHVPPDTIDLPAALATMCGDDLCLAAACAANVPGALEAFERACATVINGSIGAIDPSPSFRAEVRQALHERLFVGSPGEPPRICSYGGRGSLAAWLAIVTQRLCLLIRRTENNRSRLEDRAAAEPHSDPDDPELAYLKRRYRDEFEAAYRAALAALAERDRTLLRLNLVQGVTLDRMGAMFGVDPSTVSRWIEKARAAIRDATQEHLRTNLRLSSSEFASLARVVVSQLDVSIAALFEPPSPHKP